LKANRIITALIVIASTASLVGCGRGGDIGLRFEMEKALSRADRLADQIRQKGKNISDEDLKTLVDAYEEIGSMIPAPKGPAEVQAASQERQQAWALSSLAATRIGILYMERKMYDKGYDYFKSVFDNPATSALQKNAVTAYMALGLDKMKRYPEAAALYDTLATNYLPLIAPDNPNMDALDAPMKAANVWKKAGDKDEYEAGMEKAREYYRKLAQDYEGTLMESAALGKSAASFIEQEKFPQAIEMLRKVPPDTSGHTSPAILLMIADIYLNDLNDYIGSEKTYREFVEYYPDHVRASAATLGIGLSLFEQGRYIPARKAVEGIEKMPRADQKSAAQANYLVALCYEKDDKWEFAKGQFEVVEAAYSGSNEAFEAALYVANHYRIGGNKEMAKKEFDDAVGYINEYVQKNESDPVDCSRALGYLVRAYTENGDMAKAAELLESLHASYPQLPEGKLAPLRLADINENIFHDPQKAATWLRIFINENPDAENINEVRNHLETLEAHLQNSK
jgi:tetratricopeptide (TPR) repeat protein